jgi:hypothetical protein
LSRDQQAEGAISVIGARLFHWAGNCLPVTSKIHMFDAKRLMQRLSLTLPHIES